MISDHGFTVRPFTFNIAKWLVENGYMKLARINFTWRNTITKEMFNLLRDLPTEWLQKILPTKILLLAEKLFIKFSSEKVLGISQQIDFKRSFAFCLEDSAIYINPAFSNEFVLEELIDRLRKFLECNYGLRLKAFRCKKLYKGDKIEVAPDVIIEIRDKTFIWEKSTDLNKPLIFKPKLPGIHDRNGIFLACGSQIKEGYALPKDLEIYDIAPTMLHIFRCPIPSNMDGRVIREIFREGSLYEEPSIVKESKRESVRRLVRSKLSKLKSSK